MDIQQKPSTEQGREGIVVHESIPPLLRAIGTTVILVATLVGAIQARMELKAAHAAQQAAKQSGGTTAGAANADHSPALDALAKEVGELHQAAQEESIVDDVVLNPWFEFLGMAGTGIVAMSFYADWLSKRGKRGGL